MKYIDIHGHINLKNYDGDRKEVLQRAREAEVGMIIVATDLQSSKDAIALAEQYENVWATVGIHPDHELNSDFNFKELLDLAKNPKVVAIGECGLDYFHSQIEESEIQKKIFMEQISIANEVHKPLMLHVRNGKEYKGAYKEAVDLLKKYSKVRANFHFFAGTIEDAQAILEINATMSFTGVITFTHDYDEVIKYIPITHIMSETDCPFVSPVPYRGARNEPVYVREVVKVIGDIKGENLGIICEKLVENAQNFFNLKN